MTSKGQGVLILEHFIGGLLAKKSIFEKNASEHFNTVSQPFKEAVQHLDVIYFSYITF